MRTTREKSKVGTVAFKAKARAAGFNVFDIQLRAPNGIVSWKVNIWNGDGYADYWVTGNEFRTVGTHIFDPSANGRTTYAVGP